MTHSEYMNLTRRLAFLTREANRTRALLTMPVVVTPDGAFVATREPDQDGAVEVPSIRGGIWMAVVQVDTDVANLMDGLVDGFVEENQARADKGLNPTADFRALFDAMVVFMSSTETPGKMGVLYEKTRNRCRAWIDQAEIWSPELKLDRLKITNPTLRKILASQEYRDKVGEKQIIEPYTWDEPFIWVGSIVGLARWLGPVLAIPKIDNVSEGSHDWTPVDGVFMINGKRVTGKQLSDAYRNG